MLDHQGNATLLYFEGQSFVGQRSVFCCGYENQSAYWPNIAYFCAECGELWAKMIYDFHFTYLPIPQTKWITEGRRCVRCGNGSLLETHGIDLDTCSDNLITREFLALLEKYNG